MAFALTLILVRHILMSSVFVCVFCCVVLQVGLLRALQALDVLRVSNTKTHPTFIR